MAVAAATEVAAATAVAAADITVVPVTGTVRSAAPPGASARSRTATNAEHRTRTTRAVVAALAEAATADLVTGTARAAERWSSGLRATASSATRPARNK